ncbi:DUF222 domain-containing protein [Agromyces sp. LY-1074]|nr:DUF222 domain-containing protein [Agromyces sp. LY-1074]
MHRGREGDPPMSVGTWILVRMTNSPLDRLHAEVAELAAEWAAALPAFGAASAGGAGDAGDAGAARRADAPGAAGGAGAAGRVDGGRAAGGVRGVDVGAGGSGGGLGFEELSGPGLVRVIERAAQVKRIVDAFLAHASAEVVRRSVPELGAGGLAKQHGHASPVRLIEAATGGAAGEAARLVAVGEAIQERESFTGTVPAKFPHVRAALDTGRLSVDAANLITGMLRRVELRADPDRVGSYEQRLVEIAAGQPLSLVRRAVTTAHAQLDTDSLGPADERLHAERSLTFREDPDGVFHLRGRLDPITAAPIKAALDAMVSDALRQRGSGHTTTITDAGIGTGTAVAAGGAGGAAATGGASAAGGAAASVTRASATAFGSATTTGTGAEAGAGAGVVAGAGAAARAGAGAGAGAGSDTGSEGVGPVVEDRRSIPQIRADALAELARHALGCTTAPGSVPTTTIVVRMNLDNLQDELGVAEIDGVDRPIAASTVRKLAADAELIPAVLGSDSVPLDLGRGTRLFSRHQRMALMERDGGCASCGANITYAHAHHIRWWSRSGATDLANGVMLCSNCHHQIHDHGWQVRIDRTDRRGQVWFIPPPHLDPNQTPRLGGTARFNPQPEPEPEPRPATVFPRRDRKTGSETRVGRRLPRRGPPRQQHQHQHQEEADALQAREPSQMPRRASTVQATRLPRP